MILISTVISLACASLSVCYLPHFALIPCSSSASNTFTWDFALLHIYYFMMKVLATHCPNCGIQNWRSLLLAFKIACFAFDIKEIKF